MGCYRSEWVRCGKANCGGCPHGPYWYYYWWADGKTHKRYVGKGLPAGAGGPTPDAPAPHPHDAIFHPSTATLTLACQILGIDLSTSYEVAKRVYRELASRSHPDRGGERVVASRINCAWEYLRAARSWGR